jgi:hypothetical protein
MDFFADQLVGLLGARFFADQLVGLFVASSSYARGSLAELGILLGVQILRVRVAN